MLTTLDSHFLPADGFMATVLCTGTDRTLMQTRALILERAGHTVLSAMSEPELTELCSTNKFDVAVIGYSVPPLEKPRILRLIRMYCPSTKVLELFIRSQGPELLDADAWLEGPFAHPGDLIEQVSILAAASSD